MIHGLMCDVAQAVGGDLAAARIKGIWSSIQREPWCRNFIGNPNEYARDADVLVATSVLQAGHSLDNWFTISFDFLFAGINTFREELQFVSRLRILGREQEMKPHKYAFIEMGRANTQQACMRRKAIHILDASYANDISRYLAEILCCLQVERADSFNRHYWLWKSEYQQANTEFLFSKLALADAESTPKPNARSGPALFPVIPDGGRFPRSWARNQLKAWCVKQGCKMSAYLQDPRTGELNVANALNEVYRNEALDTVRMASIKGGIMEHLRCTDKYRGMIVFNNLMEKKMEKSRVKLATDGKIQAFAKDLMLLGIFMDYRLSLTTANDFDTGVYLEARKDVLLSIGGRNTPGSLAPFQFAEMMDAMFSEFQTDHICPVTLHNVKFGPIDNTNVNMVNILTKYKAAYEMLIGARQRKVELDIKKLIDKKVTVNTIFNTCLKKMFLCAQFKHGRSFVNPVDAMLALKCVTLPEHLEKYRAIVSGDVWGAMEKQFYEAVDELDVALTYENIDPVFQQTLIDLPDEPSLVADNDKNSEEELPSAKRLRH
jgi:hypothetical protein